MKPTFTQITKKQCAEFGQVATLVILISALYVNGHRPFIIAASALVLITLAAPVLFYPFAVIWFGLAKLLAKVVPPVVLGILFFVMVTPLGIVRRLWGRDALKLRQFKKGRGSVMVHRDHVFTERDLRDTF